MLHGVKYGMVDINGRIGSFFISESGNSINLDVFRYNDIIPGIRTDEACVMYISRKNGGGLHLH